MSHKSLLYHIVWRTYRSELSINPTHERLFYQEVLDMCKKRDCYLYNINSMPDHVHMLVDIPPTISVSEFMKVIKGETSKWMKAHPDKFPLFHGWGNGYGVFSYSLRDKDMIDEYIKYQKRHHVTVSFRTEYDQYMRAYGLEPDTDLFFRD